MTRAKQRPRELQGIKSSSDFSSLVELGTHKVGKSKPRMRQGRVIKTSSGAREVVATDPSKSDVYVRKSVPGANLSSYVNKSIVGYKGKQTDTRVPYHVLEAIALKKRQNLKRCTCSKWMGQVTEALICTNCSLIIPSREYTLDQLYSMV